MLVPAFHNINPRNSLRILDSCHDRQWSRCSTSIRAAASSGILASLWTSSPRIAACICAIWPGSRQAFFAFENKSEARSSQNALRQSPCQPSHFEPKERSAHASKNKFAYVTRYVVRGARNNWFKTGTQSGFQGPKRHKLDKRSACYIQKSASAGDSQFPLVFCWFLGGVPG